MTHLATDLLSCGDKLDILRRDRPDSRRLAFEGRSS
jgi:hypothetical protein